MTDEQILDFLRHAKAGDHTPPWFNVEVSLGAVVRRLDVMQGQIDVMQGQIDKHVPNSEITH